MRCAGFLALFTCMLVLTGGLAGQEKKQDPKKDEKKADDKKSEPAAKLKGVLPPNWTKIGLSEAQVQEVYKVQNKYNSEIAALDAKIKELKAAKDKEAKAVLTPEQKKRLEEILTGKDK